MADQTSENPGNRDAMMKSMMEMMPQIMSQCGEQDFSKMQSMMAKMKAGGPEADTSQMPEMMLKMMMPHCIGMMMPKIAADKRGEVAAAILSTIVAKGSDGMSDEQTQAFIKTLDEVLRPST
jgi:hypothetical protein